MDGERAPRSRGGKASRAASQERPRAGRPRRHRPVAPGSVYFVAAATAPGPGTLSTWSSSRMFPAPSGTNATTGFRSDLRRRSRGRCSLRWASPHWRRPVSASLSSRPFSVRWYSSRGSIPAVVAGVTVGHVGIETTFKIFDAVVAAIELLVAFQAWRTRPTGGRRSGQRRLPPRRPAVRDRHAFDVEFGQRAPAARERFGNARGRRGSGALSGGLPLGLRGCSRWAARRPG